MFNVCPQCGEYSTEKQIDPAGPYAICPFCDHAHQFLRQPLFIITGPSGAGKTTVCLELVSLLQKECVVLESDILWGTSSVEQRKGFSVYHDTWLRMAKNIGQAGRPVVLCGTMLPDHLTPCPESRYFSALHFLALVCNDTLLAQRLDARPEWRGARSVSGEMQKFNWWLKANAATTTPPMSLYDASERSVQETTHFVADWVRAHLITDND